jgi:hypothetical protein
MQQIAQMKLKGMVPNLQNPGSLTGALQGLLGGPKTTPAGTQSQTQQQQQQQPQNPLDQVIGLFGKKKKPQN